ncbi:MAG: hydrogenase subunit MbhD domain-containing protein [Halothiobacillaceae bacterium]
MNTTWLVLDALLCLGLLALAWRLLAVRDLFQAVVLFIVFGILVALAWVRLSAPDAALAEVAIGSGLAGALLLAALAQLRRTGVAAGSGGRCGLSRSFGGSGPAQRVDWRAVIQIIAVLGLLAPGLLLALWELRNAGSSLEPLVSAQLSETGVVHPVTAVLLDFRAWDTLLELAVVMLVVIAALGLRDQTPLLPVKAVQGPVLGSSVALLLPLLILVSAYLLWLGSHAPGGAFQAGAVLAAALVMLRLAGHDLLGRLPGALKHWLLVAGVLVFLTLGLAMTGLGLAFLDWPAAWAGTLILLIEVFATLSIAIALAGLFAGPGSMRP